MTTNLLKLNSNKDQACSAAPSHCPRKVGDLLMTSDGCLIQTASEVRNLDVMVDPNLSFQ